MKKKTCRFTPALVGAVILISSNCLGQVVLIGNYPPPDDAGSSPVSQSNWRAIGFTTPAQSYVINDVQVHLTGYDAADNPAFGFFSDVNASGSGGLSSQPGSLLGSFLNKPAPNSGATANFTFTPASTLTLNPSTKYWLVLSDQANNGGYFWNFSGNPNTPSGAATFGGYLNNASTGSPTGWSTSATFRSVQIDGTAVPEPVHYTLAGAGALLGFGLFRKLRTC
jgi:hypothetical protein